MSEQERILEAEIDALKARLQKLESDLLQLRAKNAASAAGHCDSIASPAPALAADEYQRYGRQMILKEIGLPGKSAESSIHLSTP